MHDSEVASSSKLVDIAWLGSSPDQYDVIKNKLEPLGLDSSFSSISENYDGQQRVLVCESCAHDFKNSFKAIDRIKAHNPASAVIVIADDLEVSHVDKLINELDVFSIVKPSENITESIKKAIEDFKDKNVYFSSMQKIKTQNEHLQTLNENLEKLVTERTKKEFEANQKTVTSLKEIQNILKFIKAISRVESIEEIMNEVRGDFKRFHGLMPPILVFLESSSQIRVYFFQGKQFVEKINVFNPNERPFSDNDNNAIRSDLSNLFGRPFGTVSVTEMDFNAQELESMKALVVCEHSFNSQKKDDFEQYSVERWPVINMALENILLKQKSHEIAKLWSKTFNEMKDPIVILDWQYTMTLSNSIFHKTIEKEYLPILEQKDDSHMNNSIQETFATGESQTADIHLSGKVYRVHSYPIRLIGEDKVSHVINQYVDVTQSIDLQSRVVQGEKMAAIGLLAGNIAHELNNPLTGIFSLSGLLLDDLDKETNTYKDLTEVKDAAQRCQRIIKDLLEFSSVGGESATGVVNLNDMVSKTLPLLKMAMRTHNCEIVLSEKEIQVTVNPQLLQQVIFNLVNNACQAMEDGGKLYVETRDLGQTSEILVRDNGPGIPDDIKKFVFDPFFTTKDEGKGTGLGLSMSRSVVERFGGNLKLNEEYKEGCEFIISLPKVD